MNVYIGRKKGCTDVRSKEIRVTSVAESVKKSDLKSPFSR